MPDTAYTTKEEADQAAAKMNAEWEVHYPDLNSFARRRLAYKVLTFDEVCSEIKNRIALERYEA